MTQTDERTPPHDAHAEQVVLGGLLLDSALLHEVLEIVRAQDFYTPAHQVILETITRMSDRGAPIDAISVNAELGKRGESARTGGSPYLHTLTEAVPAAVNAGYYAKIVADQATLRRMVEAGTRIAQLGYTGQGEIEDLLAHGETAWSRAARVSDDDPMVTTYADLVPELVDRIGSRNEEEGLVPAPYADLRHLLDGGLRPGQLAVVGGRPGHGKTTIALDFTRHAARTGHRVLFVNLEMTDQELGHKIMSAETRVPMKAITSGELSEAHWAQLSGHVARREELPITIDHNPHCTLSRIRGRVRAMARQGDPAKLIVIDYLQLITHPAADTREQQISETTRSLKLLAREMGVPIVLLAQVNREVTKREDGMPKTSDFRESGSVEQDCNIALMINNPGAEDPEGPGARVGEVDVRVAKNRGGSVGMITVAAQMHYARCVDLARV